jgi:hypothetical protein
MKYNLKNSAFHSIMQCSLVRVKQQRVWRKVSLSSLEVKGKQARQFYKAGSKLAHLFSVWSLLPSLYNKSSSSVLTKTIFLNGQFTNGQSTVEIVNFFTAMVNEFSDEVVQALK